ncbi:c-type cytochrome [Pseudodesulfovibrio sp. zrk46]|uniref:c-type cytochrome n=1 Tax=Pseudodesulfovibrio sp. zrk46 TaxID=2725288 RepID=UPI001449BD28|nr:c-type cytochrome [Pseudodesulfovibrio sp. zrk46]QJB56721.1 c-type cytochrome [Pseudodesulfovibrio sp. zrk46]
MKKVLFLLSAILCLSVTAALAVDGGALYEKKCAKCHNDGTHSSKAGGGVVLKGQGAEMIHKKLEGYLDGSYGGAKKKTMARVLGKFSPEEIKAMADHIGSM